MKEDAIWLITGGPMQHIAAKKICENGYHLIVSDRDPDAVCKDLADLFLNIDTFDVSSHLAACGDVQRRFNVKAVMTFASDCHYTVSKVAEHLNLPHIDPTISEICRDKSKTRELLQSHGLLQPKSYSVRTYQEALDLFKINNDTSFVMKATDNSGSRGFQALQSIEQFAEEQFKYTQDYGTTGKVIIEECLKADPNQISEASVETLWYEGKMYWINWVDRIFPRDLKFFPTVFLEHPVYDWIEIGHVNPAKHDYAIKKQVEQAIEQAGRALGMHQQKGGHLLKADIFFSEQGPVILELTPRSSGGWDSSGTSPARGADIAGGVVHLALGKPLTLDVWHRYFHYHHAECVAVVLSKIPNGVLDCTGRKFTLTSGYGLVDKLINNTLHQLEAENYVSIRQ